MFVANDLYGLDCGEDIRFDHSTTNHQHMYNIQLRHYILEQPTGNTYCDTNACSASCCHCSVTRTCGASCCAAMC